MTDKEKISTLSAKQFSYHLPEEKIAFFPLEKRDSAKLLVFKDQHIHDAAFSEIARWIEDDTFIVFNQSRVINARLKCYKATGAAIELFCIRPADRVPGNISDHLMASEQVYWECLVGGKKKWKNTAEPLYIDLAQKGVLKAFLDEEKEESCIIRFELGEGIAFNDILLKYGHTPLPPYIKREDQDNDKERYQTVFGNEPGSVAAPTASLHFTEAVINTLRERGVDMDYVTLHVGAGTFLPMKDDLVSAHVMHEEWMACDLSFIEHLLSVMQNGKKVLAVGTTAARTLESLYWLGVKLAGTKEVEWNGVGLRQWEPYELDQGIPVESALSSLIHYAHLHKISVVTTQTQLMIVPGYRFRIVDILQTNFHQPESTLMMLVASFIGTENLKKVYDHALSADYRFLSYGDCSLLYK